MVYQGIGDICLIKEKNTQLAEQLLKQHPQFKSVYFQGKISGKYRLPRVQWLAGEKRTEVLHKENNCLFKLDIKKVMFSKGNQEEKRRMIKEVKLGDVVVDMFAGIGYWTIPIAKFSNPKTVYAIELNPKSHDFLRENIRLNKVTDKVIAIKGDSKRVASKLGKIADKVIMGYFESESFLPTAVELLKKNGTIYFHFVSKEDGVKINLKGLRVKKIRQIKQIAPRVYHYIAELVHSS